MLKMKWKKPSSNYLRHELPGKAVVTFFGMFLVVLTLCLVFYITSKGLATFFNNKVSLSEFLFSNVWRPNRDLSKGGPAVGAMIFIVGSLLVSTLALVISTPLSIAVAIFMTEISQTLGKKLLQPAIEILVGIPSVVYGWVGLSLLVPFIKDAFGGLGFSLLAGSLVLAVMIFPTITSISCDALRAVSNDYREASVAMGATRWQTIYRVVVPAATPGILSGIVLGLARAFGEALAVQMVIGNTIRLPGSILDSTINLTSIITMDMGNTAMGTVWNNALWSMAMLLLMISFLFIFIIRKIGAKGNS